MVLILQDRNTLISTVNGQRPVHQSTLQVVESDVKLKTENRVNNSLTGNRLLNFQLNPLKEQTYYAYHLPELEYSKNSPDSLRQGCYVVVHDPYNHSRPKVPTFVSGLLKDTERLTVLTLTRLVRLAKDKEGSEQGKSKVKVCLRFNKHYGLVCGRP